MTDPPSADPASESTAPQRVRVTRPVRTPSRPSSVADEIDRQSEVGAIYMRSLMRAQLRLAAVISVVLIAGVGVIPALLRLAPSITAYRILGVPLPWLVLGAGVYPVIVGLAIVYVRRAERNEASFAAMIGPATDPTDKPPRETRR